jgi:hypothetical protein
VIVNSHQIRKIATIPNRIRIGQEKLGRSG